MSALDFMLQRIAKKSHDGESLHDAADQVSEEQGGFAIRYVEDAQFTFLRWQAGKIVSERRTYRGAGMMERFDGTVTLYHLLGCGASVEVAIAMATENLKGKVVRL
jgi:hypothetical protein